MQTKVRDSVPELELYGNKAISSPPLSFEPVECTQVITEKNGIQSSTS